MHVPQIATYAVVEKEWRTKENRGNICMMQALQPLWLVKSTSWDEVTLQLISEKLKPVAIAIIKLRLSEGISKSVSQPA